MRAAAGIDVREDLLDGRIDEVRIETVARSAEWLRIDHLSMTDQVIRPEVVTR